MPKIMKNGKEYPVPPASESFLTHGSNENGDYLKFADGTLICTKWIRFTDVAINIPWGSLYDSDALDCGDWAHPFIEKPIRTAIVGGSQSAWVELFNGGSETWVGRVLFIRPTAATLPVELEITGFGRWK